MLLVKSRRMVFPDGERAGSLLVREGKIAATGEYDVQVPGARVIETEHAVLPGIVDTHVHVNQPGRTEWEGFATACDAAAAGGITALVDMPLNSIPVTTSLRALELKREAFRSEPRRIDVGFWGGVVPGNAEELEPMVRAGALGFKCFLIDSGIEEFRWVGPAELKPAMHELARLGAPLLVHAEVEIGAQPPPGSDARKYTTYLQSRPREMENQAVALAAGLCAQTGARTHVVHHSSADALAIVREARARHLPFSAETCPHYLTFVAEEIPDGATEFKCAPPIRERENREQLWDALKDGTLSLVASDHSPCTPQLKKQEQGRFDEAWGGISGLQLALPATWTEARKRGHGLAQLMRWMSFEPARLAGLQRHKGALATGLDADFVLFDPDADFEVQPAEIRHRHKLTPYAGKRLQGRVVQTFLRGEPVFDGAPRGRELSR